MTRDYKNQLNKQRKANPVPGWVWMFCGLGIGLLVAAIVYLRSSMEFERAEEIQTEEVQTAPIQENQQAHTDPEIPRPRFEFYTILPEMEVRIPDDEIIGPSHRGVREVEQEGTYMLQVGSFRSSDQANKLKAQLLLLGLDVAVKSISMGSNGTWHRVLVGPYSDLKQLNKARIRLREQRIDTILLKVKG